MITVAIPTKNEEKHIGALLESLVQQDVYEELEVVVADAASTDRTREIALSFQKRFARLLIVEGGMPAHGRNNAARASWGSPIFFIDADMTLPDTGFVRTCTQYFRSHALAVAATPLVPRSTKTIDRFLARINNVILYASRYTLPAGAMCVVASRAAFERSGGYPEDVLMSEDHDFVRRCARYGRYGILPLSAHFSVRRLEKEGRLHLAYKYTAVTAYRMFVGPIRKPVVRYEFEYTDKENAA